MCIVFPPVVCLLQLTISPFPPFSLSFFQCTRDIRSEQTASVQQKPTGKKKKSSQHNNLLMYVSVTLSLMTRILHELMCDILHTFDSLILFSLLLFRQWCQSKAYCAAECENYCDQISVGGFRHVM